MECIKFKSSLYLDVMGHYENVLRNQTARFIEEYVFGALEVTGVLFIVHLLASFFGTTWMQGEAFSSILMLSGTVWYLGYVYFTHHRYGNARFHPDAAYKLLSIRDELESYKGRRMILRIDQSQYINTQDIRLFLLAEKKALGLPRNHKF